MDIGKLQGVCWMMMMTRHRCRPLSRTRQRLARPERRSAVNRLLGLTILVVPRSRTRIKKIREKNVRVVGATTTQRVAEARGGSQDHDQDFNKNYGHPERANEKQGSEFERANEKQGKQTKRTNQNQMTYREALLGLDNSEPSSEDNSEPSSDF